MDQKVTLDTFKSVLFKNPNKIDKFRKFLQEKFQKNVPLGI